MKTGRKLRLNLINPLNKHVWSSFFFSPCLRLFYECVSSLLQDTRWGHWKNICETFIPWKDAANITFSSDWEATPNILSRIDFEPLRMWDLRQNVIWPHPSVHQSSVCKDRCCRIVVTVKLTLSFHSISQPAHHHIAENPQKETFTR